MEKRSWNIEVEEEEEAITVMDFTGTQCADGKWNTMWTYEAEHDMGMLCGTHSGNVK